MSIMCNISPNQPATSMIKKAGHVFPKPQVNTEGKPNKGALGRNTKKIISLVAKPLTMVLGYFSS